MPNLSDKERKKLEGDGFIVIDEPRIYASMSKFAELTGRDRRTVNDRLRQLEGRDGPGNSRLYPTDLAFPAIMRDR